MAAWAILAIARTTDLSGRSCRKEFWAFFLLWILLSVLAQLVDAMLGTSAGEVGLIKLLTTAAMLATFVPLTIRRFHDINCPGWHILSQLLPIGVAGVVLVAGEASAVAAMVTSGAAMLAMNVCALWGLVAMLLPGTRGTNDYGPPFATDDPVAA